MATGTGQQRDKSMGNDNQPGNKGMGSPRIQGSWSRKNNSGGDMKVNSKKITVK